MIVGGQIMMYDLVIDYKENSVLRKSFNELTKKTFGFHFEDWYQNGYWSEKYIPYSFAEGEKIISNVSVNKMEFVINGESKNFIQVGTVMTDRDYRGQGLSRKLIEMIIAEWKDKVDGIYLFANDKVLEFYPKFGFRESKEYQYKYKAKDIEGKENYIKVNMKEEESRNKFIRANLDSIPNARLAVNNIGLITFYTTSFMCDSVYFLPEENCYVVADKKDDNVFIHQIISNRKVNINNVIHSFGSNTKQVDLGFTPLDTSEFIVSERHEEDTTLFILGNELEKIERELLMFPTLSHA